MRRTHKIITLVLSLSRGAVNKWEHMTNAEQKGGRGGDNRQPLTKEQMEAEYRQRNEEARRRIAEQNEAKRKEDNKR